MSEEWRRGDYAISTDRSLLDIDAIHAFLARSYWAAGIPRATVERSIEHSLCFGLYHRPAGAAPAQAGFARAITDYATFAYLADVYVLESHRGRGLGTWLVGTLMAYPALQGLRVWRLATKDAHGLYEKFGFRAQARPERMMEMVSPEVFAGETGGEERPA